MTPALDRLIRLITRPLESRPVERNAVTGELMARLSHRGIPIEQLDLSDPTARLEAVKCRSPWQRRGWLLGGFLLLLTAFGIGAYRDVTAYMRMDMAQSMPWLSEKPAVDFVLHAWLDKNAPDMPLTGLARDANRLRDKFPEDLAVLQEALMWRSITHEQFMTAEERDLVARKDPDNALWPYLEWLWLMHKAQGHDLATSQTFQHLRKPDADIGSNEKIWVPYQKASKCAHFHSYGQIMLRRQIESLPVDTTVLGGLRNHELGKLVRSAERHNSSLRHDVSRQLDRRLKFLIEHGKHAKAEDFFHQWRRIEKLRCQAVPQHFFHPISSGSYYDAILQMSYRLKELPVDQADISDEADRIIKALNVRSIHGASYSGNDRGIRMRQFSREGDFVVTPDSKPVWKAEAAMFQRWMTWVAILCGFVVLAAVGFEAYRRVPGMRGMARGLMPLLRRRDHLIIGMLGIGAPWLYWWMVTRLTPLGLSKYIIDERREWLMTAAWLQWVLGVFLGLLMLVQVAQRCWDYRGEFLDLKRRGAWVGWVVIAITALTIPAVGLIHGMHFPDEEAKIKFLLACVGAGSVGPLWLLWLGTMTLFRSHASALRPNLIARTLMPWLLVAVGTLLVAAGVLRYAEGWWYARDTLMPTWTSAVFENEWTQRAVEAKIQPYREVFASE